MGLNHAGDKEFRGTNEALRSPRRGMNKSPAWLGRRALHCTASQRSHITAAALAGGSRPFPDPNHRALAGGLWLSSRMRCFRRGQNRD
jgi:hypothetical protein